MEGVAAASESLTAKPTDPSAETGDAEHAESEEAAKPGCSQPVRDALNLLLLCASLRPALLASQQGVAIPLLRRVELSVDLTPVYRLAGAVADEAEKLQGVHLDVPTIAAILDEAVWHDRLEAHFDDVTRWRSSAASATFLYQPAGAVWRQ